ncbi:hypothetical protein CIT25_02330 [Mesorhizobium mediterraneum]|uniref:Transposase zinc-binding domain-containing protein n=1 Tax=Mesorhizobium mediterraneum TaxID=43617 RepID=A0AB36RGF6_9HYPH|nr:hypothetical protein CIT25_02330 [Mesorhizobium mediterraneum]
MLCLAGGTAWAVIRPSQMNEDLFSLWAKVCRRLSGKGHLSHSYRHEAVFGIRHRELYANFRMHYLIPRCDRCGK